MTTIFHVSDVHFGTEDRDALDWFAADVAAARPDLVVLTGDVTAAARRSEFAAAAVWLAALAAPVRIEPGNHDLPVYRPLLRLIDPYGGVERLAAGLPQPVLLPGVTLVSLRSTARFQWRPNWSLGHISRASLARAVGQLAAAPLAALPIVACHHPLIGSGMARHGGTRRGQEALASLARAGAVAVLTGHTHDPFDHVWTGGVSPVRLIGAGTLSSRVRDTRPSYNRITVAGGTLGNDVVVMT